jgi:PKD repeat protein
MKEKELNNHIAKKFGTVALAASTILSSEPAKSDQIISPIFEKVTQQIRALSEDDKKELQIGPLVLKKPSSGQESWMAPRSHSSHSSHSSHQSHSSHSSGTYSSHSSHYSSNITYPSQPTPGLSKPKADFGFGVLPFYARESISFTDNSEGTITHWSWDFGDGNTSTERFPTHVYSKPGIYEVTLKISNSAYSDIATKTVRVIIRPPVAKIKVTTKNTEVGKKVVLGDDSSGVVTSRSWDFGDGTKSTLKDNQHIYNQKGTYVVKLSVKGPGGEDTEQIAIIINDPNEETVKVDSKNITKDPNEILKVGKENIYKNLFYNLFNAMTKFFTSNHELSP